MSIGVGDGWSGEEEGMYAGRAGRMCCVYRRVEGRGKDAGGRLERDVRIACMRAVRRIEDTSVEIN